VLTPPITLPPRQAASNQEIKLTTCNESVKPNQTSTTKAKEGNFNLSLLLIGLQAHSLSFYKEQWWKVEEEGEI